MRTRLLFLAISILLLAVAMWWSPDLKSIAAGLALFLLGMLSLDEGFKTFTGGVLEDMLRRGTDRTWKSLLLGAVTTTLMQSSSLVSLVTISFLSAGLIDLAAGIGVIFGANLGSTTGAWLVAAIGLKVDIAAYAMPMLTFGVVLLLQKAKPLRGVGHGLVGLGLLFLGIYYMKLGFETFSQGIDLSKFALQGVTGLVVFGLLGMLATVVLQSSHASMLLIITALSVGQVTYENALALAIGANVGTTVTAVLGSIGAGIDGKRLAMAHFLFNGLTGALAIALLPQLTWSVEQVAAFTGVQPDSYALKLAIFHTLFNLLGIVVMTPWIPLLVRLLNWLLSTPAVELAQPMYLSTSALAFPETAVRAVRQELQRLYDNGFRLITHAIGMGRGMIRSEVSLADAIATTRKVRVIDVEDFYMHHLKPLDGAILDFIVRAQRLSMNDYQARDMAALRGAGRHIVEASKAMQLLRENLAQRMLSRNPSERARYDAIRLQLASLLRQIEVFRAEDDTVFDPLALDTLMLDLRNFSTAQDAEIENLIYNQRISAAQATSLMNDSSYAVQIGTHLIEAARALFHALSGPELEAVTDIALSDPELDAIATSDASPKSSLQAVSDETA